MSTSWDQDPMLLEQPDHRAGERRIRKLTLEGQEWYESTVESNTKINSRYRKRIDDVTINFTSSVGDKGFVWNSKERLYELYDKYLDGIDHFMLYLQGTNTGESRREKTSQKLIHDQFSEKVKAVFKDRVLNIGQIEEEKLDEEKATEKWEKAKPPSISSEVSRKSRCSDTSKYSKYSSASRLLARQRAKVEAAKTKLKFLGPETELNKHKAELEANVLQQRVDYESDLKYLQSQREAANAQAELDALCEEVSDTGSHRSSLAPVMDPRERTEKVPGQTKLPPMESSPVSNVPNYLEKSVVHDVESSSLPPEPKWILTLLSFILPQKDVYSDLTKFLLKKDLLLQRIINFDDKPESFSVSKTSFRSVATELDVTPCEEFDLLIKWLGPESKKHAASPRAASTTDPAKGLNRPLKRLHERYGCPEMVEASLKNKLAILPKLGNKDHTRLYELSDILCEIESTMEDSKYACSLGYFNTTSGVLTIANTLSYHIQGKWPSLHFLNLLPLLEK